MDPTKLVKMANAIADFFDADPDAEAAHAAIASHIERFWDPRMRRDLLRWIDEHDGEGLKPSAADAVRARREAWRL
jgi:formate dehydrogenase subunit delta